MRMPNNRPRPETAPLLHDAGFGMQARCPHRDRAKACALVLLRARELDPGATASPAGPTRAHKALHCYCTGIAQAPCSCRTGTVLVLHKDYIGATLVPYGQTPCNACTIPTHYGCHATAVPLRDLCNTNQMPRLMQSPSGNAHVGATLRTPAFDFALLPGDLPMDLQQIPPELTPPELSPQRFPSENMTRRGWPRHPHGESSADSQRGTTLRTKPPTRPALAPRVSASPSNPPKKEHSRLRPQALLGHGPRAHAFGRHSEREHFGPAATSWTEREPFETIPGQTQPVLPLPQRRRFEALPTQTTRTCWTWGLGL